MIRAVVGILRRDGTFVVPPLGQLGVELGVKSSYGIRNRREAQAWLSSEIVGIVFVSSETRGQIEQVGILSTREQDLAVAEEYFLRNPSAQGGGLSVTPRRIPISSIRPGVILPGSHDAITVSQSENELLLRYQAWKGRVLETWSDSHAGSSANLRIDAYDSVERTLIEAKRSSDRTFVLHAIAQLHDYGRLVLEHQTKLILLPSAPEEDLFDLARGLGIAICYELGDGFATRR